MKAKNKKICIPEKEYAQARRDRKRLLEVKRAIKKVNMIVSQIKPVDN